MLEYIEENKVDYVIVHKLDRLARNRADDSDINTRIRHSSAALVSCSESIGPTPGGQLVHGIMASIAEFYSQNLALEVNKGIIQKPRNGGTPSRAPIGYKSFRTLADDGREYRTVEVDEAKAAMVRWAFHTYAAGGTSLSQITASLNLLGLRSGTISGKQGLGMTVSMVQRMLRNPYYKGIIVWRGVEYPGSHTSLVDSATWQRVQDCLTANRIGKGARQRHPYPLSGVLKCGHCGASMVASHSRSRSGKVYPYFICNGRNNKTTNCTMQATLITVVEELVNKLYAEITLTAVEAERVRARLSVENDPSNADKMQQDQVDQRAEIERQQRLVLDAYYQDAISLEMLQREQQRLQHELREIGRGHEQALPSDEKNHTHGFAHIDLRENAHVNYLSSDSEQKHAIHRTLFGNIGLLRWKDGNAFVTPTVSAALPEFSGRWLSNC